MLFAERLEGNRGPNFGEKCHFAALLGQSKTELSMRRVRAGMCSFWSGPQDLGVGNLVKFLL